MNINHSVESVSETTSHPFLKKLHWLPVELRIHLKVLLYIFKALRGQAPQYLGQLCCYKQRPSHLRQHGDLLLQVPLTQRSPTEAAFSVQGPVLWNKLPHDIKIANSVNIFKKKLKTHFCRIYFTYLMTIFIHNYVYFF